MPADDDRSPAASSTAAPTPAPDLSILRDEPTLYPPGYTPPPSSTTEHASSSSPPPAATSDSADADNDDPYRPPTRAAPDPERNLVERMPRFRTAPLDFLREISLHVSGQGWRSYDGPVGQPVYYAGFSDDMKAAVMGADMLRDKVRALAGGRVEVEEGMGLFGYAGSSGGGGGGGGGTRDEREVVSRRQARRREIEAQIWEVVEDWTDKLICKMESRRFIRGAYYMATQLLTRAYQNGIHVSAEEVIALRKTAQIAQKKGHSIVFLPSHRTHVDYVSLQIICYRLGLSLPTVVAGDNLNVPLLGSFLQHAGAMWIRRTFSDDQLYSTLVQSYIDTLLRRGYNVECFLEGTRSRTGKLLPPKFGILGFILESILSGRVDDCIVVPVSTQYDKVIEVDSYISELLGQPKAKESLTEFLSASSVLSLKLGRVDMRFHEPWSLRGFIDEQQARFARDAGPSEPHPADLKLRLLRTLGYKVLTDINAVSVIMPTALIGTVLLTLRGRGVGHAELIRRVEWLSERVRTRGGRCAHFGGQPTGVVVARGLDVLGPGLVGVVHGLPERTYYAVDRFQLSFYRNMTIHLFILQALVSAGMYTRVKQGGGPENQRIAYEALRAQVGFLSQLFRGEFIFPTEGLDANLRKTVRGLERDDVINLERGGAGGGDDDDTVLTVGLSDAERERGRENYDFYCFLIWPTIESFWLSAVSLMMLTPPPASDAEVWLDAKKVVDKAQLLGKTLYHQGDLSYFEAVNKQTLQHAYGRFEEEGIIVKAKTGKEAQTATFRLAREWTPRRDPASGALLAEGKLWDFTDMISQSRREGKNRRDGATVRTRVLSLANDVGAELFVEAAAGADAGQESVAPVEPPVKSKKRRKNIKPVSRL